MALARRGTTQAGGGTGTSITTTLPAGVASGDLLLIHISYADNRTVTLSGWTHLTDSPANGNASGLLNSTLMYKIAGASESAPAPTLSSSSNYKWIIDAWSGTSPEVFLADLAVQTAFDGTLNTPALDAAGNTVVSLIFGHGEGGVDGWTPPSGWTEVIEQRAPSFTHDAFEAEDTTPGTGSIDPGNATMGSTKAAQGWHVLIREGAAAAATSTAILRPNRAFRMWGRRG